jgi:DNA polymerase-1
MPDLPHRPTLVVDGNNLAVRAMKAVEGRVALSADGVPTAALMVFINALTRHVRQIDPGSLVVCWDGGVAPWRRGLWPEYKAGRGHGLDDTPDGTWDLIRQFLGLANIQSVLVDDWEADDLVAMYWRQSAPTVILSGDKDFRQLLVRPDTWIAVPNSDEVWDGQRVREELGVDPSWLPLMSAAVGDHSDNIPGIRGMGPKTAAKLLGEVAVADSNDLDLLTEALLTCGHRLVDPEAAQTVRRNLTLVNLVSPLQEAPAPLLPVLMPFRPTRPGDTLWNPLLDFLDHYELRSIKGRLLAGLLWRMEMELS